MADTISIQELIERLKNSGVSDRDIRIIAQSTSSTLTSLQFDSSSDPEEVQARVNEITRVLEENRGLLDGVLDIEEELDDLRQDELSVLRKIIDDELKQGNTQSQRLKNAKERYKLLVKQKNLKDIERQGMQKGNEMAAQLLQSTMGINTEFAFLAKKGGLTGLLKGFAKGIMKGLGPVSIVVSMLQKMFESIIGLDTMSADFFKKTGMEKNIIDIRKVEQSLNGMRVGLMKHVFAAQDEMVENITDVVRLSKDQREEIARTITSLNAMGSRTGNTSRMFVELTKSLEKTPEQANEIIRNFSAISISLGRPVGELQQDFNKAQPILARFGKDTEKIFIDTAAQATFLNIDVQKLISMGERMDTFEGAAKAAQSFNMALGQPFISAQALLSAESPAEKAALFQKAYKQAGSPILSPRVQRALAGELGVDANELVRYLRGETVKIQAAADVASGQKATQKLLTATITRNQKVTDMILSQLERAASHLVTATGADGILTPIETLATIINNIVDTFTIGGLTGRKKTGKRKPETKKAAARRKAKQQKGIQNLSAAEKFTIGTGGERGGRRRKSQLFGDSPATADRFSDAINRMGNEGTLPDATLSIESLDKRVRAMETEYNILQGQYAPARQELMLDARGYVNSLKDRPASQFTDEKGNLLPFELLMRTSSNTVDQETGKRGYSNSKFYKKVKRAEDKFRKSVAKGHLGSKIQDIADYMLRLAFYKHGPGFGKAFPQRYLKYGLYSVDAKGTVDDAIRNKRAYGLLGNTRMSSEKGIESITEQLYFDVMIPGIASNLSPSSQYQKFKMANIERVDTPEQVDDGYIQPVFNKNDKFYAAKDGGAIANALDEVLDAVNQLLEKSSDVDLDISERKLAMAVDDALTYARRRMI